MFIEPKFIVRTRAAYRHAFSGTLDNQPRLLAINLDAANHKRGKLPLVCRVRHQKRSAGQSLPATRRSARFSPRGGFDNPSCGRARPLLYASRTR